MSQSSPPDKSRQHELTPRQIEQWRAWMTNAKNNSGPAAIEANALCDMALEVTFLRSVNQSLRESRSEYLERAEKAEASLSLSASGRTELPDELFDGYAVYKELRSRDATGLSIPPEAVSEVLDAAVRLIRRRQREQSDIRGSHE